MIIGGEEYCNARKKETSYGNSSAYLDMRMKELQQVKGTDLGVN